MSARGKGVGVANWLVSKTSGLLDAKLNRRSFIARATLVGSAVAAAGCAPVTRQGSPYSYITSSQCPSGSLCRDGYTEFCCVINQGQNACPTGTLAAGWWRADYSVYCNGTRYYIDCNEACCGPRRSDGFCAGCQQCRCADGCNTRKVACNYFRYGQCNDWIAHVGPIVCRMVTCTAPYNLNIGCTPSGAVDNSTANHNANCAAYVPPPPPMVSLIPGMGGAAVSSPASPWVFARFNDSAVYGTHFQSGAWTPWTSIGGAATSGGSAVSPAPGQVMVFARMTDNAIWYQLYNGSSWSGFVSLGGPWLSDPFAIAHQGSVWLFARYLNYGYYWRRWNGSTWTGWNALFGVATSTPVATAYGNDLLFFGRLGDGAVWGSQYTSANGRWSSPANLGGALTSDPGAAAIGTSTAVVFGRWTDNSLRCSRYSGGPSWGPWQSLGGSLGSDPVAATVGSNLFVFARSGGPELSYRRTSDGVTWSPWTAIGPDALISDPALAVDGSTLHVFAGLAKRTLGHASFDGTTWSAWEDLGGAPALVRGR